MTGQNLNRLASALPLRGHLKKMEVVEKHGVEPEVAYQIGVAGQPPISIEVVQKVLVFLSGLAENESTPVVLVYQALFLFY